MSSLSVRSVAFAASVAGALIAADAAHAATVTACTALNLCYCINADNRAAIDANIARIRQMLAEERGRGKSIGYLSIPLSPAGGGYFPINQEIAQQSKDNIERRFGAQSAWMLNPGAAGNLPAGASGADYMYMWTTVLEGLRGMGEDFDFFYFTGPKDFGRFFTLTGDGDFTKIEAYFDNRVATDPAFKKAVDDGKGDQVRLPQLLRAQGIGLLQLRFARRMEHRAPAERAAPRRHRLRNCRPVACAVRRTGGESRQLRVPHRKRRRRKVQSIEETTVRSGRSLTSRQRTMSHNHVRQFSNSIPCIS